MNHSSLYVQQWSWQCMLGVGVPRVTQGAASSFRDTNSVRISQCITCFTLGLAVGHSPPVLSCSYSNHCLVVKNINVCGILRVNLKVNNPFNIYCGTYQTCRRAPGRPLTSGSDREEHGISKNQGATCLSAPFSF
ncbi:hypothetical protein XELAEV_18037956mg [Xenopus laevis]|uniref:Uncharacterized protein n=1 Tax=Xenopus laevis TaxID=8355 RepID=A0A974CD74_XENLA|nr:hypothetical protein XELAEV_18037956mg [Xenopus laevis]